MQGLVEGEFFNYNPENDKPDANSALGRFWSLLEKSGEDIDIAEASLIIASQEYPGLDERFYLDKLDLWASDLHLLMAGETDPFKVIGVINSYVFTTLGFKGNEIEYADPRNSYLNDVIEQRTGIPITLSLVYLELGKRLGLPFEGIGLPGHFIIRYQEPASQTSGKVNPLRETEKNSYSSTEKILLDPFTGGTILTEEDCTRLVSEVYGRPVPLSAIFLRPVLPRQFLIRMLNNLKAAYFGKEDFARGLAIEEFIVLLNPKDWDQIRDRGALHYRNGHRWKAVYDFQTYLQKQPEARDSKAIRDYLRKILQEIAERN